MWLLCLLGCDPEHDLDVDQDGYPQSVDCDDLDPEVNPGAPELCDGVDNDCDGVDDDDVGTWYPDADGDGYGNPNFPTETCAPESGMVADGSDCNDSNADIHPETTWYSDMDQDGYGDPDRSATQCVRPEGYVMDSQDCDDDDPRLTPETVWSWDHDGDGYAGDEVQVTDCLTDLPDFYIDADDCDDDDATVYPGATETCDGVDQDCDGVIDDPEELLAQTADCPADSCLVLLETLPGLSGQDGLYWLEPPGASSGPFEAWCDMSTEGGGYSFLKLQESGEKKAPEAEQKCGEYGMQLWVPRNQAHLAAGFDLAVGTDLGPSGSKDYVRILGIYPNYNGAKCMFLPMNSFTNGCDWGASDGGTFFVHNRNDFSEPNGDNTMNQSMVYQWTDFGDLISMNDLPSGYGSASWMCSVGDRAD